MQTYHFSNCWGVFEGGGVRAAAFAGAFAAARDAGMWFSKVAGASAGAVTAALIAAGATPEFVQKHLTEKNFADFLIPPDVNDTPWRNQARGLEWLRSLAAGRVRSALTLAIYSGLYGSRHIEDWMEDLLKQLCPKVVGRKVLFGDLPKLHVVAADILHGVPKLWSEKITPTASVSHAVRCSCAIPFFFQAVRSDPDDVCVDGGVVSNVPSFVFADEPARNTGRLSARIVAFRLKSDNTPKETLSGIQELAGVLANTIVSGGTAIQMQLQPDTFVAEIDTGGIKATDFAGLTKEKKDALFRSGYQAVECFIANERKAISQSRSTTIFYGFDEKMLLFVQALAECQHSFWISDHGSLWLYRIFPSLFAAIKKGVEIHFVTGDVQETDHTRTAHEAYRRALLGRLGIRVHYVSRPAFSGFVADPDKPGVFVAISSLQGPVGQDTYSSEKVKVYTRQEDMPVIEFFVSLLRSELSVSAASTGELPTLRRCKESILFDRLRRVPQYQTARFGLADVDVDTLQALEYDVKEYKYLQIEGLVAEFKKEGIELFHPQEIVFADGTTSIVTPPVLETVDGKLVIIKGLTRAYYCLRTRVRKMKAIVVENVQKGIPGETKKLSETRVASGTESKIWKPDLWRPIEECVHPIS